MEGILMIGKGRRNTITMTMLGKKRILMCFDR